MGIKNYDVKVKDISISNKASVVNNSSINTSISSSNNSTLVNNLNNNPGSVVSNKPIAETMDLSVDSNTNNGTNLQNNQPFSNQKSSVSSANFNTSTNQSVSMGNSTASNSGSFNTTGNTFNSSGASFVGATNNSSGASSVGATNNSTANYSAGKTPSNISVNRTNPALSSGGPVRIINAVKGIDGKVNFVAEHLDFDIEKYKLDLKKFGLNDKDINDIISGKTTIEKLMQEISTEENTDRRRALLEASCLHSVGLNFNTLSELDNEIALKQQALTALVNESMQAKGINAPFVNNTNTKQQPLSILDSNSIKIAEENKKREEDIKNLSDELKKLKEYKRYLSNEIDYQINYIDPYSLKDDFVLKNKFNDDYLGPLNTYKEICAKIDTSYENMYEKTPQAATRNLPTWQINDKKEIVDIVNCLINGKITLSGDAFGNLCIGDEHKYAIETKDQVFEHYLKWNGLFTEDDKEVFNYIYNTQGIDAAYDYIANQDVSTRFDTRWLAYQTGVDEEYALAHPYLSSVQSVFTAPISGMSAVYASMSAYNNEQKIYRTDVYSQEDKWRGAISNDLLANGHTVGSFIYSTGMSMADSLALIGASALTGGTMTVPLSAAMMGSKAYTSTLNDGLDRGLSDGQAISLAWASAVTETAMESFSVGHLLKLESKLGDSVFQIAKRIENPVAQNTFYILAGSVSQGLAEGEEEFATEILNHIADELISGDLSAQTLAIENYMAEGKTQEEARRLASADFSNQVFQAFLGGFTSGICFGAASSTHTAHQVSTQIANETLNKFEGRPTLSDKANAYVNRDSGRFVEILAERQAAQLQMEQDLKDARREQLDIKKQQAQDLTSKIVNKVQETLPGNKSFDEIYEKNTDGRGTMDAYNYAVKYDRMDEFKEFLKEKELEEDFTLYASTDTEAVKIADEIINERIGKDIADTIRSKVDDPLLNFMLYKMQTNPNADHGKSLEAIEKLVDTLADNNSVVGIHRIGQMAAADNLGDIYFGNGISLTGHSSSGVFGSTGNLLNDLSRNITFVNNGTNIKLPDEAINARDFIEQIAVGGNYKNNGDTGAVMVISIPNDVLNNPDNDVIIQKKGQNYLNPKYIVGYANTNNQYDSIDSFVENDYVQKQAETEQNEKQYVKDNCLNEKGLIDAMLVPLSKNEEVRKTQERVINGESLTIQDRIKMRDSAKTEIDGIKLYSDHMYRAIGTTDALRDYLKRGTINDNGQGKGYAEVDWYLGGMAPRYGKIILEVPANPNNFELADDYGGFMSGNPYVKHAHSSNVNPISTSEISRVLFLNKEGNRVIYQLDVNNSIDVMKEIEIADLLMQQDRLTLEKEHLEKKVLLNKEDFIERHGEENYLKNKERYEEISKELVGVEKSLENSMSELGYANTNNQYDSIDSFVENNEQNLDSVGQDSQNQQLDLKIVYPEISDIDVNTISDSDFVSHISTKYNYSAELTEFLNKLVPALTEYYGSEYRSTILSALDTCEIHFQVEGEDTKTYLNSYFNVNKEWDMPFLAGALHHNEISVNNGELTSKQIIYIRSRRNQIFDFNNDKQLNGLIHEIGHAIKGYNKLEIKNGNIIDSTGLTTDTYSYTEENGVVEENNSLLGIEEGVNDYQAAKILEIITGRKQECASYKAAGTAAELLLKNGTLNKAIIESQFNGDNTWLDSFNEEQKAILIENFDILVNALYVSYSDINTDEKLQAHLDKIDAAGKKLEKLIIEYNGGYATEQMDSIDNQESTSYTPGQTVDEAIEKIATIHNYPEEMQAIIKPIYEILVKEFGNDELVFNALKENNIHNVTDLNEFFKEKFGFDEYNEFNDMDHGTNSLYTDYDYNPETGEYSIKEFEDLIVMKNLDLNNKDQISRLIHELCHASKGWHISLDGNVVTLKNGFLETKKELRYENGEVNSKLVSERGRGLEEALNTVLQEKLTKEFYQDSEYKVYAYGFLKTMGDYIYSILGDNTSLLLEAQITNDTTKLANVIGQENLDKLISITDEAHELLKEIFKMDQEQITATKQDLFSRFYGICNGVIVNNNTNLIDKYIDKFSETKDLNYVYKIISKYAPLDSVKMDREYIDSSINSIIGQLNLDDLEKLRNSISKAALNDPNNATFKKILDMITNVTVKD